MARKSQRRLAASDLTARTGEYSFDDESRIASDLPVYEAQTEVQRPPIVGRTGYDLLYDQTVTGALGKFLSALDAVEVLATLAYVVLAIWGKSSGLPMSFWLFIIALAAYHIVLRPLSEIIFSRIRRDQAVEPDATKRPSTKLK